MGKLVEEIWTKATKKHISTDGTDQAHGLETENLKLSGLRLKLMDVEGAAGHTHTSFIYLFILFFRPPEGNWEEVVVANCQMPNKLDLDVM